MNSSTWGAEDRLGTDEGVSEDFVEDKDGRDDDDEPRIMLRKSVHITGGFKILLREKKSTAGAGAGLGMTLGRGRSSSTETFALPLTREGGKKGIEGLSAFTSSRILVPDGGTLDDSAWSSSSSTSSTVVRWVDRLEPV